MSTMMTDATELGHGTSSSMDDVKARILVIEDDLHSAEVAGGMLTGAGYEVSVASDGFMGLKMILMQKPDLVVSDMWMPVGTGLSLVQRLKALGVHDVPIILITAARHDGLRDAAHELGVAAYLEKPYHSEELLAAVERALVWKQVVAVSRSVAARN